MRLTLTLAVAAAISAPAAAQVSGDCDTASAATGCVLDTNPAVIRDIGEGTSQIDTDIAVEDRAETDGTAEGAAASGTLAGDGAAAELGGVLSDEYEELAAPSDYGLTEDDTSAYYRVGGDAVRINRETREVMEIRPLGGIGTGPVGETPGIGLTDSPTVGAGDIPDVGIGQTSGSGLDPEAGSLLD